MDASDIIKTLFPIAGAIFGGPVGAAVGKGASEWLGGKLGIDPKDVTAIASAVTGLPTPERQALTDEFNKWAISENNRMVEVYLKDTQDARARDIEFLKAGRTNKRANFIVGVTFLGILASVALAVLNSELNEFGKTIINVVIGVLLADWKQITSFEFGSTKESRDKNETINNLSKGS